MSTKLNLNVCGLPVTARHDLPMIFERLLHKCIWFAVEPWPEDTVYIYVKPESESFLKWAIDPLSNPEATR